MGSALVEDEIAAPIAKVWACFADFGDLRGWAPGAFKATLDGPGNAVGTVRLVAPSDRNAYARYWFNGYEGDGEFYFGIGMAIYPNLRILDCGFSIVRGGEQHAFHASRRAPQAPTETQVGPFRIEIVEPMK